MPLLSSPKFWLKDATASSSNFASLQDGGSNPAKATLGSTDWRLTAIAFPRYALFDYGATGVTPTSSSALPSANPDNTTGDGFRSESAITRSWAAGDWSFSLPIIRTSGVAGTADGLIRVRLWRSSNADMSSPT